MLHRLKFVSLRSDDLASVLRRISVTGGSCVTARRNSSGRPLASPVASHIFWVGVSHGMSNPSHFPSQSCRLTVKLKPLHSFPHSHSTSHLPLVSSEDSSDISVPPVLDSSETPHIPLQERPCPSLRPPSSPILFASTNTIHIRGRG